MELYKFLNNTTFFYKNIFENEEFLEKVILECDRLISENNFFARLGIKVKKTGNSVSINKNYKEYTDVEKFIFENSDKISTENFQITRKDIDVNLSYDTTLTLNNKILEIVKYTYPTIAEKIQVEYSSIIKYESGYSMNKHVDGNENRICTAVFYLNSKENNHGGDLLFYDSTEKYSKEFLRYSPQKNECILFDSFYNEYTLEHSVEEIKDWQRYVYRIYFKLK